MKKIYTITFFIAITLTTIIGIKYINNKRLKIDIKDTIIVELNEEIYNTDAITSIKNGKIITKKELINTEEIGKQEVSLAIKDYFGKEKDYKYIIEVKDSEAPIITFKYKLETEEGKKIDLLKNVNAKDNYDNKIEVTIEGKYDFNKAGEYELYYVAKDSSNNIAKEKFILKVNKKAVTNGNSSNSKSNSTTNNKNNTSSDTSNKEFTTSKGFKGYTKNGITYIDGLLVVNKTYSLPSTYNPGLNSTVKTQADKMFAAAKKEKGYKIKLQSGFRSYNTQKNLYNNYVKNRGQKAADTFSARPGHSEHQSGLAFDVCENSGKYSDACINSNFDNTVEAKWLSENAYKYGFILRYPKNKTDETGYKYESWHFRYVGTDLAKKLYNNGNWITLESYFGITSKY